MKLPNQRPTTLPAPETQDDTKRRDTFDTSLKKEQQAAPSDRIEISENSPTGGGPTYEKSKVLIDLLPNQSSDPLSATLAEPLPEMLGNGGSREFVSFALCNLGESLRLRTVDIDLLAASISSRPIIEHMPMPHAIAQLCIWVDGISNGTPTTPTTYDVTFSKLAKRFVGSALNAHNAVPLARKIKQHAGGLASGTKSVYNSSAAFAFAKLAIDASNTQDQIAYLAAFLIADSKLFDPTKFHVSQTRSSRYPNQLGDNELCRIEKYLRESSSALSEVAGHMLHAIRETGMRPIELNNFDTGQNEEGVMWVRIENCKYSQDGLRAHGPHRTLFFEEPSERLIIALQETYDLAWGMHDEDWRVLLNAAQRLLKIACQKIWATKKEYKHHNHRLYDGRHQFAADVKLAYENHPDKGRIVAALMGHAIDTTADEHYAKKSVGRKGGKRPRPSPKDVKQVSEVKKKKTAKRLNQLLNRSGSSKLNGPKK
ncbi:hypothetical protein ACFQ14_03325 [Pseudahrensia aquimaris]|uniref:Tyr recombinase domain-containing protein n=1 Tax=Pseudahrensia aquimaris TaxID=744461 RepID=A0ABW3FF27_9HYPH